MKFRFYGVGSPRQYTDIDTARSGPPRVATPPDPRLGVFVAFGPGGPLDDWAVNLEPLDDEAKAWWVEHTLC